MSKLLKLSITIMLIIIKLSTLLFTSIALADHLAPEVKTQVNQQSDLFEQSINDLQAVQQQLKQSQRDNINSMGDGSQLPPALNLLTNKEELERESSKLQTISEHDLEARGREELIKHNMMSLHPDYTRPGYSRYLKDAESLAKAQDSLLSNLLGKLKDLGVDCKTVKGDQRHEPEYYLQIRQQQVKDTIYNQVFCAQLRNEYDCRDSLTLKCTKIGVRYKEWQDRVMYLGGFELWFNYHGWTHTIKCRRGYWSVHMRQDPHLNLERRNMIANRLGVKLEQVEGGTAPWDGEGKITHVEGVHHVFQRYAINYKYRDSYPVCEEWAEEWAERCKLK